jgi:hypothetical protein
LKYQVREGFSACFWPNLKQQSAANHVVIREVTMAACSVVRFKVKPGQEQKFVDAHRNIENLPGMINGA